MTCSLSPGRTGGGNNTGAMIGEAPAQGRGDPPRRIGTTIGFSTAKGSHGGPRGAIWPIGVVSFHERFPSGRYPGDFEAPESAIRGGNDDDLPRGRRRP